MGNFAKGLSEIAEAFGGVVKMFQVAKIAKSMGPEYEGITDPEILNLIFNAKRLDFESRYKGAQIENLAGEESERPLIIAGREIANKQAEHDLNNPKPVENWVTSEQEVAEDKKWYNPSTWDGKRKVKGRMETGSGRFVEGAAITPATSLKQVVQPATPATKTAPPLSPGIGKTIAEVRAMTPQQRAAYLAEIQAAKGKPR